MLTVSSKYKKNGKPAAQIILTNNGKTTTKHVILKDLKKGIFLDKHGIPYIIN